MKRALTLLCCALLFTLTLSAQTKAKPSAATPANTSATQDTAPAKSTTVRGSVTGTVGAEATLVAADTSPAQLPVGTAVKMKLEGVVSTQTSQVGEVFNGRVTEDVVYQGKTVIPVGSSIQGRIWKVEQPRRYKGVPTLELKPETVTLPNGEKY